MASANNINPGWGSSSRVAASEKWRAKSAAMGRDVTAALVDYAQPEPGMQVLDLASGTGEPAITLAGRVGPHGHVTALDLSPDLLQVAAERARGSGITNLTTKAGDAQALPFPDNSFDLGTSRFGVMFFADPTRALRDLLRVLRPGARACFVAWGPMDQPYWSSTVLVVHKYVGGPLLAPGGPNPFRFSQPGSLSAVLREAGFQEVEEEARVVPWSWPGPAEDAWEQFQAISVVFLPLFQRVPAEQWPAVHAEVLDTIRKYQVGDAIRFTATVVLASGKKR
jgi:SAM-dependent methyltransferase